MFLKRLLVTIFAIFTFAGCAAYHPLPITRKVVNSKLQSPSINEVKIQAEQLKHPLLKPVPFNYSDGLSPDEAAIMAVITNPVLRAARDRRGIAESQLIQAGILPNPRLSYDFATPVGGDTRGKVDAFGFGLDWDIIPLLSRNARIDAAKAHAASVDLEVAWQEWQVAQAARLHTYRLIIAEKILAAAKQARTTLQLLRDAVESGVELGVKTTLDLSASETSLEEAQSKVLAAKSAINQEKLALNHALGLPAAKKILLEKNLYPRFSRDSISSATGAELAQSAENNRLDLLALKLGYQSQEARVRAAVNSQFPRINLGLTGERGTEDVQTIGVGISIDLPFFDRNQGLIAGERATRKQLLDDYTARVFEARSDIARIVTAIKAAQKQVSSIDKSLLIMKTLADNYHEAFTAGQADLFSYYKAAYSLDNMRIKRIESEQKIIDLGIALEIASGRYGLVKKETIKTATPVEKSE